MRIFSIGVILVLHGLLTLAQAPQQFSFQGVARQADGKIAGNATVSIRITIHSETAAGASVYQETHTTQANASGIFNIQIGGGAVVSGKFSDISWKTFPYFLQLEMDPLGGTTYTDLGTTQMLSVPYAMHATEATKWNDGYPVVQRMIPGPDIDPNDPNVQNDPDLKKYLLPTIGEDASLIWYPMKGAFRAGDPGSSGKWEDAAIGTNSVAFGINNLADGDASTASGFESQASGSFSLAIGLTAIAHGHASVALGSDVLALQEGSIAIGKGLISGTKRSVVFGSYNDSGESLNPALELPTDRVFMVGNGLENSRRNSMTVLRDGKIGLGIDVDDPGFPLDVGGRVRIRHNGATSGIYFNNSQNVADAFTGLKTDSQIGFFINGAWRFWIDNAGNGALGGTLTQSSDRRLKRDFSLLSGSLQKLTSLEGYHYHWKEKERDQSLQTGLVAQDVEAVFPELVKTDDKGFKSLNYTGLIPHLIESVKQLAGQNEKLEAENAAFKADNKAIQDQLNTIQSKLDRLMVQPLGMAAK